MRIEDARTRGRCVQELLPQILRNLTRVPLGSYKGTYKGVEYRHLEEALAHNLFETVHIRIQQ